MRSVLQKSSELTKAYVFFIISLILIWLIDLPYILALQSGETPGILFTILLLIGNYSPLLTAVLLVALEKGGAGVKELFRQLRPKRSHPSNFLLAIFYQPVLLVAAWLLYGAVTGDFAIKEAVYPVYMLPLVFVVIFFQAGLAEEVGWTGYGLPRLKLHYSSLKASIILGIFWAIWHAPGMLIPGTFHYGKPVHFILWYFVGVIGYSIFKTYLYNRSGQSLLLIVLCHTAANASFAYLPANLSWNYIVFDSLMAVLLAIGLTVWYGKSLGKSQEVALPDLHVQEK